MVIQNHANISDARAGSDEDMLLFSKVFVFSKNLDLTHQTSLVLELIHLYLYCSGILWRFDVHASQLLDLKMEM